MNSNGKSLFITIACAIAVMAVAACVRLPSAWLVDVAPDAREAFTSEQGVPYLTDMDSYYHVRLVNNDLATGNMGDAFLDDGTAWDTRSFYPEGRTAEYQPGIVKLTEAVWGVGRLFGLNLYQVEYCLAALMSMLAAIAAFVLGYRMGGRVAGVIAGVLVACAPAFVLRTAYGRYDTDMFVVLMDVLLALLLTEAMRAQTPRARLCLSAGFGLAVLLYALCWAPQFAMLFAALFLLASLVYVAVLLVVSPREGRLPWFLARSEPRGFALCLCFAVLVILALKGPAFFMGLASTMAWTASPTSADVLPNMFVSVSELNVPALFPTSFANWFAGYVPGSQITAINGVGGIVPAILGVAALAWLAFRAFKPAGSQDAWPLSRSQCALYFLVLGVFFVGGLYAIGRGERFIEHLAVPVGLLAGACAGWLAFEIGKTSWKSQAVRPLLVAILCVAAVAPAVTGSVQLCAGMRPSATDASAEAMAWVRDNARDSDAVIAAWWDDGYYYESESGHPCLWDGGSMNGVRAIFVGKALTTDDPVLSRGIFQMLAGSGNRAVDALMEYVDARTAFEIIWEAIPLDEAAARGLIASRCSCTEAEAARIQALLHPASPKEAYLVLTDATMSRYNWVEYFATWDFSGTKPLPKATAYTHASDGTALFDGENQRAAALLEERSRQIMWQLFIDDRDVEGFAPMFDQDDGIAHVRVWRVG